VAKLLCTDHEEMYQNLLKPRIKVGSNFVAQDRKDEQVSILMQPPTYCHMYKIAPSGFKFEA